MVQEKKNRQTQREEVDERDGVRRRGFRRFGFGSEMGFGEGGFLGSGSVLRWDSEKQGFSARIRF